MVSRAAISSLIFFACMNIGFGHRDPWLYCDTCLAVIQEINNIMSVTSKVDKIQVGGFRIDKEAQKVDLRRSEVYLNEILDKVCQVMHLYGIYTNPDSKQKHVIRAHVFSGMNTPPTKKHIQTGPDVTNSISYACSTILEDYEDRIIRFYQTRAPDEKDNMENKFCVLYAKLCTKDDVDKQMWAMAEAAMMGIGGDIEKPVIEEDPIMENIEVEYLDLTDEPEEQGWKAPKRPRQFDDDEESKDEL